MAKLEIILPRSGKAGLSLFSWQWLVRDFPLFQRDLGAALCRNLIWRRMEISASIMAVD